MSGTSNKQRFPKGKDEQGRRVFFSKIIISFPLYFLGKRTGAANCLQGVKGKNEMGLEWPPEKKAKKKELWAPIQSEIE